MTTYGVGSTWPERFLIARRVAIGIAIGMRREIERSLPRLSGAKLVRTHN